MATVEKVLAAGGDGWFIALVLDDVAKLITGVHIKNPGPGTLFASIDVGGQKRSGTFPPPTDLLQPLTPQGYSEPIGPRGMPVFRASDQVTAVLNSLTASYA